MKTKRGTEMARFRMPQINTDLKSYFSHFRKGILTIIGIALIGGLIVASFVYGNNEQKRQEQNQTAQTEQAGSDQQSSESSDRVEGATGDEEPVPIDNNDEVASGDQSTASQPSSTSEQSSASVQSGKGKGGMPAKGPEKVVNTGPEDWAAPLAATALYLLFRKYRADKKAFAQAFLK